MRKKAHVQFTHGHKPEVHVSIDPVGDYVWDDASRAAAHDENSYSLHWSYGKGQSQQVCSEWHDDKLAWNPNQDAPRSTDMSPQLTDLHGAAESKYYQRQQGGEDYVQGLVEGRAKVLQSCIRHMALSYDAAV